MRSMLAVIAFVGLGAAAARADDTATKALVDKADRIYRGTTSAAVFEMHVKTASYERSYEVVVWDDSRHGDRALVKILGPALWRGFGTLKIGDSLKLYDPKSNRVTVVGQSMLGDSWMGSHFSNDDLVQETRLARDFDVKATGSHAGELAGQRGTFHDLDLTPKPTAPVAWGRIAYQVFEAGDLVLPVRADYYRKAADRKAVRSIVFDDVASVGGRTIPKTMTITVAAKPGESTSITYKTIKFDVAIPDSKFTDQALRR
jgi:Outer membrane lipoprotein-sorting protein